MWRHSSRAIWAITDQGGILLYADEVWQQFAESGTLPSGSSTKLIWIAALWMKADGSEGWGVGHRGEIIRARRKSP